MFSSDKYYCFYSLYDRSDINVLWFILVYVYINPEMFNKLRTSY